MSIYVNTRKLILVIILIFSLPVYGMNSEACRRGFSGLAIRIGTQIKNIGTKTIHAIIPPRNLEPEELLALSTRPLRYYFEESIGRQKNLLLSQPQHEAKILVDQYGKPIIAKKTLSATEENKLLLSELRIDQAAVKKFLSDFEQLKRGRKRLQGFSKFRKFEKWLEQNQEQFLTKPVLELFLSRNYSMGDFLDYLHLHFLASEMAKKKSSRVYRWSKMVVKHPALVALIMPILSSIGILAQFLWQLTVLGPGVQMINSYTEPVVQPLTFGVKQQGAKHFQGVAQKLQELLSGHEQILEFKKELQEITERIKGISPEEAQKRWSEFELMYFRVFQKYQQVLPTHLREGRSLYRDWVIQSPVFMASALANLDNQYWLHKKLLSETEKEILEIKNSAKEVPQELMEKERLHSIQVRAAEERIAATLASWKLYEFMYPEFSKGDSYYVHKTSLNQAYNTFKSHMHFEIYIEQFGKQMQNVLEELEFHYALRSEISRVLDRLNNENTAREK